MPTLVKDEEEGKGSGGSSGDELPLPVPGASTFASDNDGRTKEEVIIVIKENGGGGDGSSKENASPQKMQKQGAAAPAESSSTLVGTKITPVVWRRGDIIKHGGHEEGWICGGTSNVTITTDGRDDAGVHESYRGNMRGHAWSKRTWDCW